jgi:hypothetical protein
MSFSKLSKFIDVSLNNQNTVYNFIFFNLNYEKKKKKKKNQVTLGQKRVASNPLSDLESKGSSTWSTVPLRPTLPHIRKLEY